jgi:uncharacterized protein (TIGR03435 family)
VIRALPAFLLFCGAALGQSAPQVKPFEVASVRVHSEPMNIIDIRSAGNRLNAVAEMPRGLIMWAYKLRNFQAPVTPPLGAMDDVPYDIVAKAEGDGTPSKDEFRQMLQLLLTDRFKMAAHREMREMPVYALVVGKNGPKLKPSAPDAGEMGRVHVNGRNYEVTIPKADMDRVVDAIMNSFPDRPVIDETGLTGTYDLSLVFTPQTRANLASPDSGDITIFAAVQEQLGLKLEARKAMVEVLMVDRIEKPAEN